MDYSNYSLAELKAMAKDRGLRGVSTLKKNELAELLANVDKMMNKRTSHVDVKTAEEAEKPQAEENVQERLPLEENKPEQNRDKQTDRNRQGGRTRQPQRQPQQARPQGQATQGQPQQARPQGQATQGQPQQAQQSQQPQPQQPDQGLRRPEARTEKTMRVKQTDDRNYQEQRNLEPESEGGVVNVKEYDGQEYNADLDSGEEADGILEVMAEGYGFIRSSNYLPGDRDIYVSPVQIRKFGLKKGDMIGGPIRNRTQGEKFSALLFIRHVNGGLPSEAAKRVAFEDLTPIFPDERIKLDVPGASVAVRIVDLLSPIGKGQRGMIVSPPKAGKTTLLKAVAKSISRHNKDMHLIVLLIDERPEEVMDIRESIEGENVEVIYSTFDELPEHHKRVSEMVIERAKRLVEHGQDVVILLDSITRLARAYNLTVPPSGRTLSGGLDPAALHMPKRFFGAARNMREGGSLTILATALVETGSRMDDVVFEGFKGTGNMELVLDRKLSEKRIFPAIDISRSGTRRDDLLLDEDEQEAVNLIHKALSGAKAEEYTDEILKVFARTKDNKEFISYIMKMLVKR
ncbi:MAG: transcription termination factor Rho [Lachnospiraceae bacterium]|nr:transcription termination factor Rho [Lachnospiraceae bacterium]